ncbi:DUF3800 domain-containing protein [Bermanella marisrubri]|uniref:3-deoxy-D-manno-octulosonic-acid transferase n=1 Tax=Bermanella marisrubri TaxID=207949 RepID=Q1N4B8_9GAMM|nr:DUF3800 domain-containing protein [Bermanella marisrubri]EAT12947.1 hypothetical protein RED65_14662 [Oceanobacter sp. RED65] [Bermanella marisrubri]QIZ82924.1 DUF3800 domain-containing protein [Bermanella marisrubri]
MTTEQQQLPLFELDESLERPTHQVEDFKYGASDFSRYIVYVDESGDHSLKSIDENYPIFVLAFCIFHKRHYSEAIVSALEKFKFNWFGHDQVVLHEHEIRKEKGDFNIFKSRENKLAFMGQLAQIIEYSNFILVSCSIDKLALKKRGEINDNPYHLALGFCMETLYEFLEEKNQHNQKTHIVVECRGKKEDQDLELEFRRVCDGNNRLNKVLPFEIIFSDKKVMSSGLQLADLVARPIGLNLLRPNQENRAFDVLRRKFYCDGGRKHVGEGFEGIGMKIFPS